MNPHDKYWKKSSKDLDNTTIDNIMAACVIVLIFAALIFFLTF